MSDQLENGSERLAITDANSVNMQRSYVTDSVRELRSAKEMYYCWLSRLVIFLAILSLAFFTSASLVLFKLVPEVTVEPFLIIKQDNSESMVRYETISQDMSSANQMMETFIRQYVTLRNTVLTDEREMQTRWFAGGMVSYLSSPAIFDNFRKQQLPLLNDLLKNRVVRDVEIISIGRVGGEKSPVWKVDFRTYDLSPNVRNDKSGSMVLVTKYWTASVTAFFIPERMFMSKRLMNPLGFTVTRYSQTEVEIL